MRRQWRTERHHDPQVLSNVKKFQMVLKTRTTSQETVRLVNVSSSD